MGFAAGAVSTDLAFDNDATAEMTQQSTSLMFGYRLPSGWTFRGSVGAIIGGTVTTQMSSGAEEVEFDLQTGFSGGIGATRQWSFATSMFATWSADISASRTKSKLGDSTTSFVGTDVRFGGTIGKTFADVVSPYAALRVFGGPVFWELAGADVVGTDTSKFQMAAGAAVRIGDSMNAFVDVAALGEQAVSLGLSYTL